MNIQDYKTLIVLFAPMAGGNHLTNIVSLSPHITNRAPGDYDTILETYYNSSVKDAHTGAFNNVSVQNTEKIYNFIKNADNSVVVCGHIDEVYYVYNYSKIQELGKVGFIVFENFDLKEQIVKRMGGKDSLTTWAYRADVIVKVFGVTETDTYVVNPNNLFVDDPTPLLLQMNIDLKLDIDIAKAVALHKKWFKKIQ